MSDTIIKAATKDIIDNMSKNNTYGNNQSDLYKNMNEVEKKIYISAMNRLKECKTTDDYRKLLKYAIHIDNDFIVKYILENVFNDLNKENIEIRWNINSICITQQIPKIKKYMEEKYPLNKIEKLRVYSMYTSYSGKF